MQAVYSGDLKQYAQIHRSRRYRGTVSRIAADLALNTADQRAGSGRRRPWAPGTGILWR
jgi:hypothetical protein